MIERILVTTLSSVTPLVFGAQAPPGTAAPYLVFRQVSGALAGVGSSEGEKRDRWQIDAHTNGNYSTGRSLARAIISALPFNGRFAGICVLRGVTEGPTDQYDPDTETFYQSVDYIVNYVET